MLLWPVVALVFYQRMTPARALIWTVLGGYLLLPPLVSVNLPVVPDMNKESIPNLVALFLVLFYLRDPLPGLPRSFLGKALIGLFVLSPFATVLTNADVVPLTNRDLQGMRIYDSFSAVTNQAIALLPFFLARRYLASEAAMKALLVALMVAGLIYSVPMLIESRVSPQMNIWVYGFFQHDFFQTIRFGGYRPVVFLPHGLWVAFFALMCALAATVLWRTATPEERPKLTVIMLYLMFMLIICKSAGPVLYAMGLVPMILLAPRRWQIMLAAVLSAVVIVYPLLRGAHLVPLDSILDAVRVFNAERAYSLEFRIMNEEALLNHSNERPLFGWGGYGRSLLYDPLTGQGTSIADGAWIITLGIYGWMGYIAQFGLLALPLLLLGREAISQRSAAFSPYACVVALIFAANMVDMLPNATLIPFTWLMAGAILGHAEGLRAQRVQAKAEKWRAKLNPRRGRTVL